MICNSGWGGLLDKGGGRLMQREKAICQLGHTLTRIDAQGSLLGIHSNG